MKRTPPLTAHAVLILALVASLYVFGCRAPKSAPVDRAPQQRRSEIVRAVAYDEGTRDLTVYFHQGDIHVYHKVPKKTYENFMNSHLKGGYYKGFIEGRYPITVERTTTVVDTNVVEGAEAEEAAK